jgi:hypothetical protein
MGLRAFIGVFLLFGTLLAPPAPSMAAPPPEGGAAKASPESKAKRSTYPYHGELAKADLAKRVIYLSGKTKQRVIIITSRTRIKRGDKSAKLDDAKPGEAVSGTVQKNAQGLEEAITLNLKGAPPKKPARRPSNS